VLSRAILVPAKTNVTSMMTETPNRGFWFMVHSTPHCKVAAGADRPNVGTRRALRTFRTRASSSLRFSITAGEAVLVAGPQRLIHPIQPYDRRGSSHLITEGRHASVPPPVVPWPLRQALRVFDQRSALSNEGDAVVPSSTLTQSSRALVNVPHGRRAFWRSASSREVRASAGSPDAALVTFASNDCIDLPASRCHGPGFETPRASDASPGSARAAPARPAGHAHVSRRLELRIGGFV